MSELSDAADAAVSAVRSAYSQLKDQVGGGLFGGLFESDAQKQVDAGVATIGPLIDTWASRRSWAQSGSRPDGSTYGWDLWVGEGQAIASDITAQGSYYVDGSAIGAALDAVKATAAQLGTAASNAATTIGNLALSGWVWWVGAGLLLAVVAAPYVVPLLKRGTP